MHTIRWLAYGLYDGHTKTFVHFFPSSGGVTAPYPSQCKILLFGDGIGPKSVTLDGGRVSHPDGVAIGEIFSLPASDRLAMLGLSIEVTTQQPRLDISPSSCLIEIVTKGLSTRYHPCRLIQKGEVSESKEQPAGLALRDSLTNCSLVFVNSSESRIDVPVTLYKKSAANPLTPQQESFGIAPNSVHEIALADRYFTDSTTLEQGSLAVDLLPISIGEERREDLVCYFMYRDTGTGYPISIMGL